MIRTFTSTALTVFLALVLTSGPTPAQEAARSATPDLGTCPITTLPPGTPTP